MTYTLRDGRIISEVEASDLVGATIVGVEHDTDDGEYLDLSLSDGRRIRIQSSEWLTFWKISPENELSRGE